eukprot:gnl/MRDRNA2_/MRDRNA2_121002_c0_seq1.p1 gnl/MRDRNA2_/MRDRNA2_121002_c0~~gnl/MRDRNA2_/MRDRNA2_121002_c0_seq1.p1  ORF type:complete len:320 (+),score=87.77 gnl/MRDRNA2_/MRDRNA2_121002_c0_seq1:217-1176(+)
MASSWSYLCGRPAGMRPAMQPHNSRREVITGNSKNKVFTSEVDASNHNRWSEPGEFEKDMEALDELIKQREMLRKEEKRMEKERKEREREEQRQMRERRRQEEKQQLEERQQQRQEILNNIVAGGEVALKKLASLFGIPHLDRKDEDSASHEEQEQSPSEPELQSGDQTSFTLMPPVGKPIPMPCRLTNNQTINSYGPGTLSKSEDQFRATHPRKFQIGFGIIRTPKPAVPTMEPTVEEEKEEEDADEGLAIPFIGQHLDRVIEQRLKMGNALVMTQQIGHSSVDEASTLKIAGYPDDEEREIEARLDEEYAIKAKTPL